MNLVIGGDHAGFHLKGVVVKALHDWGHTVADIGAHTPDPVDFPDLAWVLCDRVRSGAAERGIMVCGTGIGACIAANKVPGIRAALCHDVHSAHQSVEHDDSNVLCLGAQIVGEWLALDLIQTYLGAEFDPAEAFQRRVAKIADLERRGAALLTNPD
jgi:ribose 5-phosphate isomerase B